MTSFSLRSLSAASFPSRPVAVHELRADVMERTKRDMRYPLQEGGAASGAD
jgi:hypothetical protein